MNQYYQRTSMALDAQGSLNVQAAPQSLIGSNNMQTTGRSLQQLYDALNNDIAANQREQLSATQSATSRQWMVNNGFSVVDWERDMNSLRACQKLISDERQAQLAPGAKFGRLGGNRALNNQNFIDQVYESGSSNNQAKIGKRLEKKYYSGLLAKLQ